MWSGEMETKIKTDDKLEDAVGLSALLDAVAQIAFEKAEHIATNWQDASLAKQWEKAGGMIAKAASKIEL
jgi:hypothetical protein